MVNEIGVHTSRFASVRYQNKLTWVINLGIQDDEQENRLKGSGGQLVHLSSENTK